MANILSDNVFIEKKLRAISDQIESAGGFIHSNVDLSYDGNRFSIHKAGEIAEPHLIKIPDAMLVRYHDFDIDLEGQDIVIAPYESNTSSPQYELFSTILALYNESGVFKNHLETNPWLNYAQAPELMKLLLQSRGGPNLKTISEMLGNEDYKEELALFTFFKKRMAYCQLDQHSDAVTEVYLPLLEFIEHHPYGAPYERLRGEEAAQNCMAIRPATPVAGSDECFSSFGSLDALDAYMHYGKISATAPIVRSIPLSIKLPKIGTVNIRTRNKSLPAKERPEHLRDLGHYLPLFHHRSGSRQIGLSHIIIPNEQAPRSLRRILHEVLIQLEPKLDEHASAPYVEELETIIIDRNLDYYRMIISLIPAATTAGQDSSPRPVFYEAIYNMAMRQIHLLESYNALHGK
tara:strand:- start:38632 stop:39846 length:1215 start_codon:yes stop_codon:yes gene_type:complete